MGEQLVGELIRLAFVIGMFILLFRVMAGMLPKGGQKVARRAARLIFRAAMALVLLTFRLLAWIVRSAR